MNSSEEAVEQNPVYLEFGGQAVKWPLFMTPSLIAAMALIGVPLNISVCWITFKYRKAYTTLRSNTSILLALASFFEILSQSNQFLFFFISASGINFIPIKSAFPIQAHAIIGILSATLLLPLLSADRLLAVVAPIFYRNMKQRIYISLHLLIILLYNVWNFTLLMEAVKNWPKWLVTGDLGDVFALPGIYNGPIFPTTLFLLSITIVAYILVGLLVKCKTQLSNENTKKLYQSLFLIVLINVGGYFVSFLASVILSSANAPFLQYWTISNSTGILLNIAAQANAVILYLNSKEYKSAYLAEFKWFKRQFNIAVHPVTTNTQIVRVRPAQTGNDNERT